MLDTETKRRIDTARDILVGKVPNPASQVEQITIALIYKFMDDMDKEVEELGGKPSFFRGDYAKYSWSKIFDPKLSGFEIVALYGDALDNMNLNPDIPSLFREIFKNAYLPYRDPETLKSFLKIINEFHYTHSEKLGDAYEYLLSIMSSQGDAGQFRTPRHIIDFIVEVVNPRKSDKILDPACGTAGFLISSYKHILKSNTKKSKGDLLTPEDKNKLTENLTGYDISPDMVRISLVNMYLHGFSNPKIFEYDTLTSEDRWNEYYDVVLANPPFMSPKGGIRPHKRFSIQAKRSEVLFVDYIAEHLTPSGKAGVIVPEGIIFQSGSAYKNLRKMLVENYLWAVVSLPAGIFNPYSGVKTSILLLDKALAKSNENILFVKVENDGYDLGAQRRKIDKDNLPAAKVLLKEYIKGKTDDTNHKDINYLIVPKQKISENGDYNLSMDRYRENVDFKSIKFKSVKLEEICEIRKGSSITKKETTEGSIPVIAGGQIPAYYHNKGNREGEVITVSSSGAYAGFINYFNEQIFASDCTTIQTNNSEDLNCRFLYNLLKNRQDYFYSLQKGGAQPHVYSNDFKDFQIPLPPLEVQQEIVNKIESYQKIINGAKQIIENYKPEIDINPDWEIKLLKEICTINPETINQKKSFGEDSFFYIDISSVENGTKNYSVNNIMKWIDAPSRARRHVKNHDVLLSTVRPNLKAFAFLENLPLNVIASTGFAVLRFNNRISAKYVYEQLFDDFLQKQMISRMGKGAYPSINQTDVENLKIPYPPLHVQQQIVDRIENEQKLIDANKELVKIYEQKIKDEINKVWEE
jgi:type I restriction enzyme M protein